MVWGVGIVYPINGPKAGMLLPFRRIHASIFSYMIRSFGSLWCFLARGI